IVSSVLRLPMSRVDVRCGDTAEVPRGIGSFGSRTGQAAGSATFRASHELLAHARELAADALGEDEDVIAVVAEGFVGPDGAAVTWSELVRRVQSDGGKLAVEHQHDGKQSSAWPSGAVLADR